MLRRSGAGIVALRAAGLAALIGLVVTAGDAAGSHKTAPGALRSAVLPAARQERVDELYADFDGQVPGVALVVLRDGDVLYSAAYGLADLARKTPVTVDTAFYMASSSEQMTALAVLLLADRGKLRLSDPAARYVPELRGWGDRVTIRDLLQHTGGIPDTYDALERLAQSGSGKRPTDADAIKLLSRWRRLDFPPGSRFASSNTGYDLLGWLVEKVSGQPFGRFLDDNVFRPLGMRSTFVYDEARRRRAKRALGYAQEGGRFVLDDDNSLNLLSGSGSLYTTVEDLARYDRALFRNRLLKPATLAQMFEPGRLRDGRAIPYGLGWDVDTDSETNDRFYGHSGSWMGFNSYYLHYPEDGVSVIILSNSSETDVESLAFETADVFRTDEP